MLTNLSVQNSLLQAYLAELRDVKLQTDRARFRKNVARIGSIMAYEVSKILSYSPHEVTTPLAPHISSNLSTQPVLATVLRAGLAMHEGFLEMFDKADCAYVSAYRKHLPNHAFEVVVEYLASPDLNGRTLILIDPMLATGQSMHLAYKALLTKGKPEKLIVVSLIASEQGVKYVENKMPEATIFVGTVDPELNADSYIVPGLGDAGDLCFGEKL